MAVIGPHHGTIDIGLTSWELENSICTAKDTICHHSKDLQQNTLWPDIMAIGPCNKENSVWPL